MIRRNKVEENKEYLKSAIGVDGRKYIDWENGIGKEIKYEYRWYDGECSEDVLKIRKYEPETQKVYFEGYEKGIRTSHLIRCKLGGLLGFQSSEFKYEINKTIDCLTLIDKKDEEDRKGIRRKYYKYHCNDCGNEDWIAESSLKNGIRCNACGDGISYPEKLMEGVLIQVGVKYKRQYKIDKFKYDFYLPKYNAIIEVHGGQHGQFIKNGELTLVKRTKGFSFSKRDEIKIDADKSWKAYKNEVKHYIVIDCRKSKLEYIKNNILDNELNKLFDLNKVDWCKCEEYALKNKVKEVCDYYNEHYPGVTTADLVKKFGMSDTTIRKYLNEGKLLEWCKYDGEEESRRGCRLGGKAKGKPILQFTLDGEFINKYPSAVEVGRQTGISRSSISACCNGKYKTAGGFIWKFAE